jgi:hypothetical protein
MTAEGMLNGILRFGSEDKVLDQLQFGSFGQGSASMSGHSRFGLVVSRPFGSDVVTFTGIWLDKPVGQIHSYVYFTQSDGSLFQFSADQLPNGAPLGTGLANNRPMLPKHGTIRRQLQVAGVTQYYSQRSDALYYGLTDRLFGCPAWVRMAGDDDPGHINNRRGRAWELDAVAVGENLPRSDWRLMGRIAPTNLMIHHNKEPVGMVQVKAWVVSTYRTKPTKNKPKGEIKTPAQHMLEGRDRAAPRSILVTLSGQTLSRLHSTRTFCAANLREINENLIVQVLLDLMPEHTLQDAELFTASRDGIVEWLERALCDELQRMLGSHPDLLRLAREMMPPEEPVVDDRKLAIDINRMMRDPIVGDLLGYRIGIGTGMVTKPGETETEKRKKKPPEDIIPRDPPTFLHVRKNTVVPNATNWITLHTDAPDHYGAKLDLVLPPFLVQMGPATLREGRMTVGVSCDNALLGTIGKMIARLRGTNLVDEREITVVSRKETPKKTTTTIGTSNKPVEIIKQGPPTIKLIEVHGQGDDTRWVKYFGSTVQDTDTIIAYYLNTTDNVLEVAINVEFPKLIEARQRLERNYGAQISRDFFQRLCQTAQIKGMILCRNELLDTFQGDELAYKLVSDVIRGDMVNLVSMYSSPAIRNSVLVSVEE